MSFKWGFLFEALWVILLFMALFIASRRSIQSLYILFHTIFRNNHISTGIIAVIFFPGTLIHELSHFIMAILLLHPVHKLSLFPKFRGNMLRLGYVLYEKKDVVRSLIVGIAPVIVGVGLLWWLYSINFVDSGSWAIMLFKSYIIFVLTSTMFSSKQDLIDLGYVVPMLVLASILCYLLEIPIFFFLENQSIVEAIRNFMYSVSIYAGISLIIHIVVILISKTINRLLPIHQ